MCPTALSSNEHALHVLSQAEGRTGALAGQVPCCSDHEEAESGKSAARALHITGWLALLLPLLWPLLALMSFAQRLHVVKVKFPSYLTLTAPCGGHDKWLPA